MEIKDGIALGGVIIGFIGFSFALYQYRISQKWRKSEFAAKQLELLSSDPDIAFCCQVLDYIARRIPTPEKYRVFTGDTSFVHNQQLLVPAMQPEAGQDHFEWPLVIYRDSFDRFFGHLESINHYISIKLFTIKDVSSLEYWLMQISNPRFVEEKDKLIFINFIKAYKYLGVLALMDRFKMPYPGSRA